MNKIKNRFINKLCKGVDIILNKIVDLIIQTAAYFCIVLLMFFIAKQIGMKSDTSIWVFAIGSTIGYVIVRGVSMLKKTT